jgi:hypothetical protein
VDVGLTHQQYYALFFARIVQLLQMEKITVGSIVTDGLGRQVQALKNPILAKVRNPFFISHKVCRVGKIPTPDNLPKDSNK